MESLQGLTYLFRSVLVSAPSVFFFTPLGDPYNARKKKKKKKKKKNKKKKNKKKKKKWLISVSVIK